MNCTCCTSKVSALSEPTWSLHANGHVNFHQELHPDESPVFCTVWHCAYSSLLTTECPTLWRLGLQELVAVDHRDMHNQRPAHPPQPCPVFVHRPSRLCTGCGLPNGLDICGSGLRGGYLNRCSVSVMVYLRWRPGSQLRWILRGFFPGLVVISCKDLFLFW